MKVTILLLCLIVATTAFADIRETCEDAYYATDYVKLHEYIVHVDWSKISDPMLEELENIIYGPLFLVTKEQDLDQKTTIYNLKEVSGFEYYHYANSLNALNKITSNGVSCLYRTP